VERELFRLCELVSDRLRESNFKGRTITLKIRLEGFQTYTRSITLPEPTNFSEGLIRVIRKLFADFPEKEKKVRLVGVRVSNLSYADEQTLFKLQSEEKKEEVYKAVDKIKKKFGRGGIFHASGVNK
jgi:DNA polymerase-4